MPGGKVKLPKLGRPVKDILSREQIERLEDTARTERDRLIISVFGDTGMRVGELVRLQLHSIEAIWSRIGPSLRQTCS